MRGKHWDIFCSVVDNFGDIGVCWRLARQLATERGLMVRLWVDDLDSFRHLCPEIDPRRAVQALYGVEVLHWTTPFALFQPDKTADVVIEAFACELPETYLAAMAARPNKPVWINLEYLSAEDWIGGSHGLASPHPRLPLTKHFFFPGFVAGSGGLLREASLMQQRLDWLADRRAGGNSLRRPSWGNQHLLFCYENPCLSCCRPADAAPVRRAWYRRQACSAIEPRYSSLNRDVVRQGNLSLHAPPSCPRKAMTAAVVRFEFRAADSGARPVGVATGWHIYLQILAHLQAGRFSRFIALACRK